MNVQTRGTGLGLTGLAGLGLVVGLASCGKPDYVKTNATLGKVVVYRNGVAYFERRAKLDGDELRMSVPSDKVDDFLKSLTVRDATSGKSLPISFPHKGHESGGMVDMVVRLPEKPEGDVILTYITDSPAWKPSYRVVIADDGKVQLEGWAIVDNTSGENWRDVLVGVGSSSALSFRYDLWSIRDVHRQTLANSDQFAVAPPQGASTYRSGSESGKGNVVWSFADTDINMPSTHPNRVALADESEADDGDEDIGLDSAPSPAPMASGAGGSLRGARRPKPVKKEEAARINQERQRRRVERERRKREALLEKQRYAKNQQQVKALAAKLRNSKQTVIVEGWAAISDKDKDARALDRANVLRNQLIQEGVPPAQLQVRAAGAEAGRPAGARLIVEDAKVSDGATAQAAADAGPVGESHFQSATPMSVGENSSVMVSIIKDGTEGEIVYFYDPESSRGNARYAFKAVRFENPTKSTLEAGPVTVFGDSRFVGEGITDPIPPESMALVPFALDRQIVVEKDDSNRDQISKLVKLERGILTTEVQHIRKTKFRIKNRLHEGTTLYVRHSVLKGWNLVSAPKNSEKLGDAHLFPVTLKAGESKEVTIEEATPMTKTLDLRAEATMEIVKVYLSGQEANKEFSERMQSLMEQHRKIADHQQEIDNIRERMRDYRERMDELHVQIVSLKAVKSGGKLLKHLQVKMEDISERVQRSTIALVELQEKLMLARIKFQDGVAELSLDDAAVAASK